MAGRRRGRTGRGWDAAPPRARRGAPGADRETSAADRETSAADRETPAADRDTPPPARGGRSPAGGGPPPEPGDPAERAREICLRQLAVRPRTRAELATALRRHGVADEVAAEVLDRYADVGMIDDAAFAQAWVSTRHHSKGLARRALGSELRQRGVEPEAVGRALGALDSETEAETARALVDRKLRGAGSRTGDPQAVVRRLVGMLARKGYPAGLAFRVVKEALAEHEDTAPLADQLDPDALAEAAGEDPATAP